MKSAISSHLHKLSIDNLSFLCEDLLEESVAWELRVSKPSSLSRSSSAGGCGLRAGALSKGGRVERVRWSGCRMCRCALATAGRRLDLHMTRCWDFFSSVKEEKVFFVLLIEILLNWKLGVWYFLQLFCSDYFPWQTASTSSGLFFFPAQIPFKWKVLAFKKHLKSALLMALEQCVCWVGMPFWTMSAQCRLSQVTVWPFREGGVINKDMRGHQCHQSKWVRSSREEVLEEIHFLSD